jgi:hypothetical protein
MNLRTLFNVKNQTNNDPESAMGEFTATLVTYMKQFEYPLQDRNAIMNVNLYAQKTLSLAGTKYKTVVEDITEQHSNPSLNKC